MIDEIFEERVVTIRGQASGRQKMSGFPLRKRSLMSRRKHDWTHKIVSNCA